MESGQVRRRKIERHCAAAIRALSSRPNAEFRRQRLYIGDRGISLYTPHLAIDVLSHSLRRCRGVADAIALRLRYSDEALHRELMPADPIAGLVFDALEQLRTESLVDSTMLGIRKNLDGVFNEWCRECRAGGLTENEPGLLIYSVIHIARSRLNAQMQDEAVEGLIESVRFRLAPLIGDQLALLRKNRFDQARYAELTQVIAAVIGDIVRQAGGEISDRQTAAARHRMVMPPTHDGDDRYIEGAAPGSGKTISDHRGEHDYAIFCKDYDRQATGVELYRAEQRVKLRAKLDRLVAAQAISIPRLAQRLQKIFAVRQRAGWDYGEEEGYPDGRRIGQLVSNPSYKKIFKQEKHSPFSDAAISFLIDNSGSMKRQRYEAVAVMIDVYSRALELAGIKNEVLGFTTGGWSGGQSIRAWRKAGSPESPGRLNDRLHIVYKDAETPWRRARYSISSLLNPLHFREGLDGEALEWAAGRLGNRIESRKCLVMISDGAPMDSATGNYNDAFFLERHLKYVAHQLERSSDIELRAIGIALDMEEFFHRAVSVDLTGTLGNREFQALEYLFGN